MGEHLIIVMNELQSLQARQTAHSEVMASSEMHPYKKRKMDSMVSTAVFEHDEDGGDDDFEEEDNEDEEEDDDHPLSDPSDNGLLNSKN